MSFTLTNNFFLNARGITFEDDAGLTWSFNKNTNQISATVTSGATLSSVGLADTSTTPIYTVTNSPLIANGTLDITLKTQAKNLVFAGPATGANAQPTFRALVVADIPTIPTTSVSGLAAVATTGAYSSLSGTPTIPTGANPTATSGPTAVNGTATTFLRSDGAPGINLTASYSWTGAHAFLGALPFASVSGSLGVWIGEISNNPTIDMVNTSGGTDAKTWEVYADTTTLHFRLVNDAYNAANDWLAVTRSGTTPTGVKISAPIGVNRATPPAQSTGWGTPTGGSVQNNFAGGAASLATLGAAVAQLITVLKANGFLGA